MGKKKRTDVLFDFVVVVKLDEKPDGELVPVVDYRYPPIVEKPKGGEDMVQNIVNFCFPDIGSTKLRKKRKSRRKTFCFVLTDLDGSKKFGYCVRGLPDSGDKKRYAECFCLVSFLPCVSLFEPILELVEKKRAEFTRNQIFVFLQSILAHKFPAPGEALDIRCINPKGGEMEKHTFIRPPDSDNMLAYHTAAPLLAYVSEKNILRIFAALLKERPVLMVAKDVDVLADCVQAMVALLYPFSWQGALIPVMPEAMLDFVCAPVPFLLGVLKDMMPRIKEMQKSGALEKVLCLYIDKDKFKWAPNSDDWDQLPKVERKQLEKGLLHFKKQYKSLITAKEFDKKQFPSEHLHIPFVEFFASFFGNYQAFITIKDRKRVFDMDKFMQSSKPEHLKFVEEFCTNTQMFGMFMEERELHLEKMTGVFERKIQLMGLEKPALRVPLEEEVKKPVQEIPKVPCEKCGRVLEANANYCPGCGRSKNLTDGKKLSLKPNTSVGGAAPAVGAGAVVPGGGGGGGETQRAQTVVRPSPANRPQSQDLNEPTEKKRAETALPIVRKLDPNKVICERCGLAMRATAETCFSCGTKKSMVASPAATLSPSPAASPLGSPLPSPTASPFSSGANSPIGSPANSPPVSPTNRFATFAFGERPPEATHGAGHAHTVSMSSNSLPSAAPTTSTSTSTGVATATKHILRPSQGALSQTQGGSHAQHHLSASSRVSSAFVSADRDLPSASSSSASLSPPPDRKPPAAPGSVSTSDDGATKSDQSSLRKETKSVVFDEPTVSAPISPRKETVKPPTAATAAEPTLPRKETVKPSASPAAEPTLPRKETVKPTISPAAEPAQPRKDTVKPSPSTPRSEPSLPRTESGKAAEDPAPNTISPPHSTSHSVRKSTEVDLESKPEKGQENPAVEPSEEKPSTLSPITEPTRKKSSVVEPDPVEPDPVESLPPPPPPPPAEDATDEDLAAL